jgi:hypothetical protein
MPCEKQRDEREQCDERERTVVAAKQTPRRTGVAPVDEFEEAVDDNLFVARFEQIQNKPFGKLVEHKDDQRERGDAAVRFVKNGLGGHGGLSSIHLIARAGKRQFVSVRGIS